MELQTCFCKQWERKKKQRKIALITMGKLNSTGKTASKGFIDSDISHGEFNLAVNEEKILSG